jgi:hypothetical protein
MAAFGAEHNNFLSNDAPPFVRTNPPAHPEEPDGQHQIIAD